MEKQIDKVLNKKHSTWSVNKIKEVMTDRPITLEQTATIQEAYNLMLQKKIRHIPVMDRGQLVGIVSDRSVKQAKALDLPHVFLLRDIMVHNPYCVTASAKLKDVIMVMAKQKLGSAVVLNEDKEVIGIFTSTDALYLLGDLLERTAAGQDYHLNMKEFISGNIFY